MAQFTDSVTQGVPLRLFERAKLNDRQYAGEIADAVFSTHPEILVCPGWGMPSYRALFFDPRARTTKLVMSVDSTWTASPRQLFSRLVLRGIVKRLAAWMAAGERGRLYARYLGVPAEKIFTSTYCYDDVAFANCLAQREAHGAWPHRFLYVGRYVPEKGCETLLAAYRAYRAQVADPWPLACYGHGPLKDLFAGVEGVELHDFVQPADLPTVLSAHSVYILPSRFEPWGVSLAEAAGAGMALIASDQVTSGVDLVRPMYNGLVFPAGNEQRLTHCLRYYHTHPEVLPSWGERSRGYAGAFSAAAWAERYLWMFKNLMAE